MAGNLHQIFVGVLKHLMVSLYTVRLWNLCMCMHAVVYKCTTVTYILFLIDGTIAHFDGDPCYLQRWG